MSSDSQQPHRPVSQRDWCADGLAQLSRVLATLAIASLLHAGVHWAQNGVASVLNHTTNGVAAILMLLLWINERYSPAPWISRALRERTARLTTEWAEACYAVAAGVAFLLLALAFYQR